MATPSLAEPAYQPTGYQMIRTIEIRNFRCYQHVELSSCKRLNIIVGDNGVGKTALLEAIFFPLAPSSDLAARYRRQRGLDGAFHATAHRIEDALWGDLFFNGSFKKPIVLSLNGDGPETRTVFISRGMPNPKLDFEEDRNNLPITLVWRDAAGNERTVTPTVTDGNLTFPGTGEDLPDFFYFASNQTIPSGESASRFSEMSRQKKERAFVEAFTKEYPWIENINIEISGGVTSLFASVKGEDQKRPLPNLSGGINRLAGIMVTMASHPKAIMLIDEIENGLYHKHHVAIWRRLLDYMRQHDSQLFVTTHSGEMLKALGVAAGKSVDDIALWRVVRAKEGRPKIQEFTGKDFRAGIETETEMR